MAPVGLLCICAIIMETSLAAAGLLATPGFLRICFVNLETSLSAAEVGGVLASPAVFGLRFLIDNEVRICNGFLCPGNRARSWWVGR